MLASWLWEPSSAVFVDADQYCGRHVTRVLQVKDLETVLEPIFASWKAGRKAGEGFGDWVARVGHPAVRAAAAAVAAVTPAAAASNGAPKGAAAAGGKQLAAK